MKSSLFGLTLAAVASLGLTSTPTVAAETGGWTIAGVHFANPIDSSTWYEAANEVDMQMHEPMAFNFADPDFWMGLVKPETHSVMHHAMLNPNNWQQFTKVETYTAMMNPTVWMKWTDVKTYAPLVDPQTYVYRMQPGAYMHIVDANAYAQLADPSAYMGIMTSAMKTMKMDQLLDAGKAAVGPIMQ